MPRRSAREEAARLNRARRAAERKALDDVLCDADKLLHDCREHCMESLLQLCKWRPQEALRRLSEAVTSLDQARTTLRGFFDGYGSKDE